MSVVALPGREEAAPANGQTIVDEVLALLGDDIVEKFLDADRSTAFVTFRPALSG